jgi:hypothetical protein
VRSKIHGGLLHQVKSHMHVVGRGLGHPLIMDVESS